MNVRMYTNHYFECQHTVRLWFIEEHSQDDIAKAYIVVWSVFTLLLL